MIKRLLRWIFKTILNFENEFITKRNLKIASYRSVPYIRQSSGTVFTKKTYIGKNCSFNGMRVQGGGKLVIGDNFHSGEEILVILQNHNYNNGESLPYDGNYIFKDVIIEDNVWVGSRVVILGGVRIGEGAIIQAGSVVVNDIPKYAIAGGHPATAFSYRDKEHYEKLKKERKFL